MVNEPWKQHIVQGNVMFWFQWITPEVLLQEPWSQLQFGEVGRRAQAVPTCGSASSPPLLPLPPLQLLWGNMQWQWEGKGARSISLSPGNRCWEEAAGSTLGKIPAVWMIPGQGVHYNLNRVCPRADFAGPGRDSLLDDFPFISDADRTWLERKVKEKKKKGNQ